MTTRRLAAIVVVDVAGFSAMMAADEEGTLATLKAHRTATDPIILNHGGRIVKTTGDGMIIEIPSATDAVRAAVQAQETMARRNAQLPADRRMHYRIGIDLGDVIVEGDDLYGGGVNVAARLEQLADPGGICVSETVHSQVGARLSELSFRDGGERVLRNIPEPVRVWMVEPADDGRSDHDRPGMRRLSVSTTVAVLPFQDPGADGREEYFADGITEDLITALSHDPELRLVSRSTVFAYKHQAVDLRTLGRRLDARYVVTGSVRRAAGRVRITARLIESETDRHLWADRYDRDIGDVFALQDEIVHAVRTRVGPAVRSTEERRVATGNPRQLGAWELLQRGRWHASRHTYEDFRTAVELGEQSLESSPSVLGHVNLSAWWMGANQQGWRIAGRSGTTELIAHAESAQRLDPDHAMANAAMAWACGYADRLADAIAFGRRAVQLNPHIPLTWFALGVVELFASGDPAAAVEAVTEAWRLGSHESWRWHTATVLAYAHYLDGNYAATHAWAQEALKLSDYAQAHAIAAASLGMLERPEEARRHLDRLLEDRPDLTVDGYRRVLRWRRPVDMDHFAEGLAAAGLPAREHHPD